MFASVQPNDMPAGGHWISHTRDPLDTLDGEDAVSWCHTLLATTPLHTALFVGHSMGAVPAVKAARKWMLSGHRLLGVVLVAPAVDANDRFWDSMPLQYILYLFLCSLLPEAWQWLVKWAPVFPIILWWVILSYLGNGWASLDQVNRQCRNVSNGLCAVQHLITVHVANNFNETLAFLLSQRVDVLVVYDPKNGMFSSQTMSLQQ
jgi:pimeloyl-ACP methyl ester carboxylesterase